VVFVVLTPSSNFSMLAFVAHRPFQYCLTF